MPRVELYGGRKVATQPRPNVQRTDVPTPASFGVGVGDAALGALAQDYMLQQRAAKQRATEVRLLEFDTQLAAFEHARVYDAQTGALNTVKGKDAYGLTETLGDAFDTTADKLMEGMTEEQRFAASRLRHTRRTALVRTLDAYASQQGKAYEQDVTEKSLELSANLAVANFLAPQRVAEELARQRLIVSAFADHQGMAPEAKDALVQATVSKTHDGVIRRLLTVNPTKARDYFDAALAAGELTQANIVSLEPALHEGDVRAIAQKRSDEILAMAPTAKVARDAVAAITDPEVRDQVDTRVQRGLAIKKQEEADALEATMVGVANLIDQGKPIPADVWVRLPIPQRDTLERYQRRNDPGGKETNDIGTWFALMELSDKQPDLFKTVNLYNYVDKLGKTEFKELVKLQQDVRQGKADKVEAGLDQFRTNTQVVNDLLAEAGIKDEAVKARFANELGKRVGKQERLTGAKVSNEDVKRLGDELLVTATLKGTGWFGRATTKRAFEVSFQDIPAVDKLLIRDALRTHGVTVIADDLILNIFRRRQVEGGGRDYEAITKGLEMPKQ